MPGQPMVRARFNGAWVDLVQPAPVGLDEVFIGPVDPYSIDPLGAWELWISPAMPDLDVPVEPLQQNEAVTLTATNLIAGQQYVLHDGAGGTVLTVSPAGWQTAAADETLTWQITGKVTGPYTVVLANVNTTVAEHSGTISAPLNMVFGRMSQGMAGFPVTVAGPVDASQLALPIPRQYRLSINGTDVGVRVSQAPPGNNQGDLSIEPAVVTFSYKDVTGNSWTTQLTPFVNQDVSLVWTATPGVTLGGGGAYPDGIKLQINNSYVPWASEIATEPVGTVYAVSVGPLPAAGVAPTLTPIGTYRFAGVNNAGAITPGDFFVANLPGTSDTMDLGNTNIEGVDNSALFATFTTGSKVCIELTKV